MALTWSLFHDTPIVCIQLATDLEFTKTVRTFCLPPCNACSLDTGVGAWFVRIGVWVGTDHSGVVEWSGTYGPTEIVSKKGLVPVSKSALAVIHTQPIQNGLRIHTGALLPSYAFLEYSEEPQFLANRTTTLYVHDNGRGHVDCMGLLFPHTYFIRFRSFTEAPGDLPTASIKMLGEGIVLASKKPAKPIQHSTHTDRTHTILDVHLVREVKEHKNFRFSSYTDYVKHKAAAERLREGV